MRFKSYRLSISYTSNNLLTLFIPAVKGERLIAPSTQSSVGYIKNLTCCSSSDHGKCTTPLMNTICYHFQTSHYLHNETKVNINSFHLQDSWNALLCQHKALIIFRLRYLSRLITAGQAGRAATCWICTVISAIYPKVWVSAGHKGGLIWNQISKWLPQ